jgi:hypothetical protein
MCISIKTGNTWEARNSFSYGRRTASVGAPRPIKKDADTLESIRKSDNYDVGVVGRGGVEGEESNLFELRGKAIMPMGQKGVKGIANEVRRIYICISIERDRHVNKYMHIKIN